MTTLKTMMSLTSRRAMLSRLSQTTVATLCAGLLPLSAARAATTTAAWPSQTLRLVVPFAPGGGTDIVARALGQELARELGQPVVVENRPGGATVIGAQAVARATDAHTVLLSGSSTFTVNPALRAQLPYRIGQDLLPVASVASAPLVLLVAASSPWRTLADLLAEARRRPGQLNYATFGSGSAPHLAGALLGLAADVKLQDIPYKGSAPALAGLVGGELQLGIDTVAAAAPLIQGGRLRALAVLGAHRATALPGVPSVAELKLPQAAFEAWYALAVPTKLPEGASARLEQALRAALARPALREQLQAQAMEPQFVDAIGTRRRIEEETARYRALAHRAGIAAE